VGLAADEQFVDADPLDLLDDAGGRPELPPPRLGPPVKLPPQIPQPVTHVEERSSGSLGVELLNYDQ